MIGRLVRRMLGPLERPVTQWYRGFFFDCRSLARSIHDWMPATTILEVGCGEGELTECLAREFPEAAITGIDVTARVGRLFRGDRQRVTFRQETIQDFAAGHPERFDLVVICDVLHHVDCRMRTELIEASARALKPGGGFVVKDWERTRTLIHLLGYLSDRYLTGDRIRYATADELRNLIRDALGTDSIRHEHRCRPRQNNVTFFCLGESSVERIVQERTSQFGSSRV